MIHFVTTAAHGYTVTNLVRRHGKRTCRAWSYDEIFEKRKIPVGTWVFTDHERLTIDETNQAARVAQQMEAAGCRVLNHPAFVRSRFETLRRLREAGINDFSVFRADASPRPTRFPVFIRNEYDHDSSSLALLENQAALDAALHELEAQSIPLVGKLVIEYAVDPIVPDTWMRLSTYHFGGTLIAHHIGFDSHWIVKDGFEAERMDAHPCKERMLELERDFVTSNLYAETMRDAFDIARIDYGRADFSLMDGRVQVYEINTNPMHGNAERILEEIHPGRKALFQQSETALQREIEKAARTSFPKRLAQAIGLGPRLASDAGL